MSGPGALLLLDLFSVYVSSAWEMGLISGCVSVGVCMYVICGRRSGSVAFTCWAKDPSNDGSFV